jgi:hypothetical protein
MIYDSDSDVNDVIILFKYRELSDNKSLHKSISKINYADKLKIEKIDFKQAEELSKINNNKNLIKFLNVIPLDSNRDKFGTIINNKHILSDGTSGILYKYSDNLEVFIYDENLFSYKGIVYKKGQSYLKFSDSIIASVENKEYNLVRRIGNYVIYIKDNKILFVENQIKSIVIPQKSKNILRNKNYITFDIECYLDKNMDFIPYYCG